MVSNISGNSQQAKVSGSRINNAAIGATLALGAGAAGYYFTNPLKNENTFKDSFVRSINEQEIVNQIDKDLNKSTTKILEKFGLDEKSYDALYNKAKNGDETAKTTIEQIEKALKNNNEKITTKVSTMLIDNKVARLNSLESLKTEITGLADDVKPEELKKILQNKPELFPKAKTAEELEKAAEKFAQKGKTGLLENIEKASSKIKNSLNKTVNNINTNTKLYDKTARKFTQDAPESFSKILKQFKWKNACKWSGITALTLLIGNWIFKSRKQV